MDQDKVRRQVVEIYEAALAHAVYFARMELNDKNFGADFEELARLQEVAGLSAMLQTELLHLARIVAEKRADLPEHGATSLPVSQG